MRHTRWSQLPDGSCKLVCGEVGDCRLSVGDRGQGWACSVLWQRELSRDSPGVNACARVSVCWLALWFACEAICLLLLWSDPEIRWTSAVPSHRCMPWRWRLLLTHVAGACLLRGRRHSVPHVMTVHTLVSLGAMLIYVPGKCWPGLQVGLMQRLTLHVCRQH